MSFQEAFATAVAAQGRRASWGPWQFIEAWRAFVDEVASGYAGDLYEYENELSVRDDLQTALSSHRLTSCAEWLDLRAQIIAIDDRLHSLVDEGPEVHPGSVWWRARLPGRAANEFAEDAKRLFGVEVYSE